MPTDTQPEPIDVPELKSRVRAWLLEDRTPRIDLTRACVLAACFLVVELSTIVAWANRGMPHGPDAAWYDRAIAAFVSLFLREPL